MALPGYGDSGYGDSGYGDSGYGDSGYGDSGYGDSGYGDSGYGDSGYGDSGHGGDPGDEVNTAPTRTGTALMLPDAPEELVVDLWLYFDDAQDGPDLDYQIVSIENAAVFDSTLDADGFLTLRATAGAAGHGSITIRATDSGGLSAEATFTVSTAMPTVSITDRKHTGEGGSAGFFVVSVTGSLSQTLEVPYQLSGAVVDTDYTVNISGGTGDSSGVLQFAPGLTQATVTINPLDNEDVAPHKQITLTLSAAPGVLAGRMSDSITLHDDDGGAVVYVSQVRHTREGSDEPGFFLVESIGQMNYQFNPESSDYWDTPPPAGRPYFDDGLEEWTATPNFSTGPFAVRIRISGSALLSDDYTGPENLPTVNDGGSWTVLVDGALEIPIVASADDLTEGDEEVTLELLPGHFGWGTAIRQWAEDGLYLGSYTPTTYALGSPDSGTLTIEDDLLVQSH